MCGVGELVVGVRVHEALQDVPALWLVHHEVVDGSQPITAVTAHRLLDVPCWHVQHRRHELHHLRGEGRGGGGGGGAG